MSRYENERPRRKKSNPVVTVLTTILLIVAIAVFCGAAYMLYGYYKDYKAGTDEYAQLNDLANTLTLKEPATEGSTPGELLKDYQELSDPKTVEEKKSGAMKNTVFENMNPVELPLLVNPIDFTELNKINEEVIGWIKLDALDITYPVAQSTDNDYYLHRTFKREDNFAGCIFLNCDNKADLTDQNTIVYGHNMKNGSMFGKLKDLKDQETYDQNPYFWIFTKKYIYQYRIFSCSTVQSAGDPYRISFTTDEFEDYINTSQKNSVIDNHGVQVDTDDRIVTLSTCTGDSSTRFIVQGMLEQVYIAV